MSRRSKLKRANQAQSVLHGAKSTLDNVRAQVGRVLVRTGEDIPLDPDSTLNLIEESERRGGGTPSFQTRKADPMRAFTSTAVQGQYIIRQNIGDDTAALLEQHRNPGEDDNALIERLLDGGLLDKDTELSRLISRDMALSDPAIRAADDFSVPKTLQDALRIPVTYQDTKITRSLKEDLRAVPSGMRYDFLKRHVLEMIATKDLDAVASSISFVRETMSADEADMLVDEVIEKSCPPAPFRVSVEGPGGTKLEKEIDAAVVSKIMGAMSPLRQDQRDRVLQGLNERFPDIGFQPDRVPLEEIPPEYRGASKVVVQEMRDMAADPKLQRLGESCFHKCVESWKSGALIVPNRTALPDDLQKETGETWFEGSQVFVVNHNWAAAFKNSAEFSEGAWHLPYPRTVFEFRISGRRCALALIVGDPTGADMRPLHGVFNVETSAGWVMGGLIRFTEDGKAEQALKNMPKQFTAMAGVIDLACTQARAICITLEAQVAVTEIIRAPHKLNQKRERQGKMPIFDYHVVDLAHRKRYAARLPEPGDQEVEHGKKRLHWVRAHTRHYPNHKVQIKWHLRGDPDLGFVDKEYRL